MTDCTELVKRLRIAYECDVPNPNILLEAADAIEELVREEKFHAFLWNVINPNEMEAYLSMYYSENVQTDNVQILGMMEHEPPKEET